MAETTGRLHLKPEHRATIEALLKEHLPGIKVWAYGSRVNGRSHDGSDLDLVLRGPDLARIDTSRLIDFTEALRDSTIPFLVDAHDWAGLPERFHREIERDHVVLTHSTASRKPPADWIYHPLFPVHWDRRPLYSMAQWVNGLAYRNIEFSAAGRPIIKIAEIKGGISDQTKFTYQNFDESVRVRAGDLLFSWSGQPETSIDAFWWHGPEGWLNQHIFRVTPSVGTDTTFFFYILRYLNPNFVAIARNKQTTGLGHVTKRDLENIEAALPEYQEQRAIAHILGTLDDKIELNHRVNETMEAMARTLFKSWFVDFDPVRAKMEGRDTGLPKPIADLFPDRMIELELGLIPDGWEVLPLSQLIEINPKRSLRKGEVAPYLDMANMPTRGHVPHAVVDRQFGSGMRFTNGDTLVARITPCLENGKTAYVDFLQHGEIGWGSTEYIVMRPMPPLPNEFAYYLARSTRFREFAIQNMTGTSGRQRVPATTLSMFPLPAPPKSVTECFGKLVKPLTIRASEAERESHTLAALRDTLIPKLISGEIRLRDAATQIESVA